MPLFLIYKLFKSFMLSKSEKLSFMQYFLPYSFLIQIQSQHFDGCLRLIENVGNYQINIKNSVSI